MLKERGDPEKAMKEQVRLRAASAWHMLGATQRQDKGKINLGKNTATKEGQALLFHRGVQLGCVNSWASMQNKSLSLEGETQVDNIM